MKITRVETFLVAPRWLFCRIETDDGLVGWGEPVVEGRALTVRAAVHELAELLIGADPLRVEDHWQRLTKGSFYRGGPVLSSAVAGLDQALWDIAGKALDAPVHQLLGGPVRDRVRVYGWIAGDEPAEVADAVTAQVEAGLTAVKMNASGRMSRLAGVAEIDGVLDRLAAAREALGPHRDVALDFHGRFTAANARRIIPLLADARPMFVEEPVLPEYSHLIGDVVRASPVPIACGERLYSRGEFLPVLQAGIAVAQPDLSHAGGISEVRRIGALAETFDVPLAPHCPLGPISLAASLQIAFSTPNFLIQEQSLGIHYNAGADLLDYVLDREMFRFHDGHLLRPTGPGLGVTIDEAAVRKADETGHDWHSPIWRHDDGSLAEW
ncbi:galactonate dehydratase [Actinoalloteichus hoggarensis]|uniref:D-galactonate dehydratase n=1 Tax=Actinoalloteichus hoggarensis TaxID=1470176 RepID=A0A221W393_9PSEU|nr:galactonate dehydratase [Actinoalloteichus hoggarensis]ASO20169.1 D-galactonate dehydratase [Actinoalloteichus hoggarensis]MBB5919118.1 galactonate dehydratase [Actinoalloteichus hoggarensis]